MKLLEQLMGQPKVCMTPKIECSYPDLPCYQCECYKTNLVKVKVCFADAVIEHYTTSKSLGDHKDSHSEICEAAKWLKEQE